MKIYKIYFYIDYILLNYNKKLKKNIYINYYVI